MLKASKSVHYFQESVVVKGGECVCDLGHGYDC